MEKYYQNLIIDILLNKENGLTYFQLYRSIDMKSIYSLDDNGKYRHESLKYLLYNKLIMIEIVDNFEYYKIVHKI